MSTFTTNPENPIHINGLLRVSQICGDPKRGIPGLLPIGKSTFWAGVRDGRFPQPIKLGARTTCWRAADILALIGAPTVQGQPDSSY